MNVFDQAMKLEQDGQALYERLAEQADVQGLKIIFHWLAMDEKKHFEIFQAMKKKAGKLIMAESKALEGAKNIFAELQREKALPAPSAQNLDAYQFAMKVEAESVKLYQDAADRETNPEVKNLLLRIAVEERHHYNILENIYEFVNAPNRSLAWAEFSNLKEF